METSYVYNFVTEEFDAIANEVTDWSDYVPQIGGRRLYQILVEHKEYTPLEAASEVLERALGKHAP